MQGTHSKLEEFEDGEKQLQTRGSDFCMRPSA